MSTTKTSQDFLAGYLAGQDDMRLSLQDPATVWASILRGTIARPQALDHYEDLKARAEAIQHCEVDARRYRWLRDCREPAPDEPRVHRIEQDLDTPQCRFCQGLELDLAIDKALRQPNIVDSMGPWVPEIESAIAQCIPVDQL